MSWQQVLGLMLMIIGAVMTFFVKRFVEDSVERVSLDKDGDYSEVLSKTAIIFKIIGFIIVVIGAVIFFYFS